MRRRGASQSSSGQRVGVDERVGVGGTDWAPNSLTKRTRRGIGAAKLGELAHLAAVPAEPQVAVGAVELGEVRQHAAVGDGRAACGSACSKARLTQRSSTDLFQRRQLLAPRTARAGGPRVAPRAAGRRRPARRGRTTCTIDGWWPSRSTASRAWRTACLAHAAGVAPLQREVLPAAARRARRRRRTARAGDVGVDAQRSRPASTASSTSRRTLVGRGVGEARRVGRGWRP